MLKQLRINNYKSILEDRIDLGRINVFIGANGSGKSNIIEAIAMLSASRNNDLVPEGLINRGVRVALPSLTLSSFLGRKPESKIKIGFSYDDDNNGSVEGNTILEPKEDTIFSEWEKLRDDSNKEILIAALNHLEKMDSDSDKNKIEKTEVRLNKELVNNLSHRILNDEEFYNKFMSTILNASTKRSPNKINSNIDDYVIYNLNIQALRGISVESFRTPLGIYGEGLDVLLANMKKEEVNELLDYKYLISWLDKFVITNNDNMKYAGYKLGRSKSNLYFKDKYMRRSNNMFSAENSNEGALHILFYLTLFISNKTPSIFAIDNIETALNPMLCRELMICISKLAEKHEKQALITTHNPAILDGLNLHDDEQRLFEVYRNENGHTKTRRIKTKKDLEGSKLKLSEMWMRGHLGARPDEF